MNEKKEKIHWYGLPFREENGRKEEIRSHGPPFKEKDNYNMTNLMDKKKINSFGWPSRERKEILSNLPILLETLLFIITKEKDVKLIMKAKIHDPHFEGTVIESLQILENWFGKNKIEQNSLRIKLPESNIKGPVQHQIKTPTIT
jgi:hypothetical protein